MRKRTLITGALSGLCLTGALIWATHSGSHVAPTLVERRFDADASSSIGSYAFSHQAAHLDVTGAAKVEFEAELTRTSPEWSFAENTFPRTDDPGRRVSAEKIDVDGDGKFETAYYITGTASCGAGNCDFRIYKEYPAGPRLVLQAATGPLFYVLPSKTASYADVAFPAGATTGTNPELYSIWRWTN